MYFSAEALTLLSLSPSLYLPHFSHFHSLFLYRCCWFRCLLKRYAFKYVSCEHQNGYRTAPTWHQTLIQTQPGDQPHSTTTATTSGHPLCRIRPRTLQIKCNDKCTPSNWKGISLINYDAAAVRTSEKGLMTMTTCRMKDRDRKRDLDWHWDWHWEYGQPTVDFFNDRHLCVNLMCLCVCGFVCNAHLNNNSAVGRSMAGFCFFGLLCIFFHISFFVIQ